MTRKPNVLIALGLAVFVIGVTSVLLILRDDDSSDGGGADTAAGGVLVVREAVSAGTTGNELIQRGLVRSEDVPAADRAADALTSTAELAGQTIAVDVRRGEQITRSMLRTAPLRTGRVEVPDGKQAVAITIPSDPGVAGYVSAGDLVNVFAVVTKGGPTKVTKLVLQNVEVLDVSTEIAPRAGSTEPADRAAGSNITYLLALDASQAEQLIFLQSNESVYLSLLPKAQARAATSGRAYANVFG